MSNIKIFVSHRIDQDSETIDNSIYVPVRCGAVYDKRSSEEIGGMLGDDTGDNISEKRNSYCELTVQYWAWKNVEADYYGLCHYRRYFVFSEEKQNEDIFGAVNCDDIDDMTNKIATNDFNFIEKEISQYDALVSTPFKVSNTDFKNVYEQYQKTPHLFSKDMDMVVEIIDALYPDFSEITRTYLKGELFYPCNMFIMKKEIFGEYCSWLFPILQEFEKRSNFTDYSIDSIRTTAHLAERLLGVYYTYLKSKNKYKLGILQRTMVWNTDRFALPRPVYSQHNVPVVLACSDYFVPYASITLASLLKNTSLSSNYDIVFLHTDISIYNQGLLEKMVKSYSNCSIRFLNISKKAKGLKAIANNHVSIETFYRLFSNQIFFNYEKILYLDSDLVVQADVAELYNIDLKDDLIGAATDPDHAGEYNGAIPGVKEYCDKTLKMQNPYSYFQAGVVLFNIKKINEAFPGNILVEFAEKKEYMYVDQDVLNAKCEGRVYVLDMAWNVMTDCDRFRVNGIIRRAPKEIYDAYMIARKNPKIIHYAGCEKPWNSPTSDMADVFWEYARTSPFYEAILWRMSAFVSSLSAPVVIRKSMLRKVVDAMFPKGTKRRERLKCVYYKFLK